MNMALASRYIRTKAGTSAALDPQSQLPRPLKQLLVAINGQFDPYAYAVRTQGLVDVKSMLHTLEGHGLVRALPDDVSPAAGRDGLQDAPQTTIPLDLGYSGLRDSVALMSDFVVMHLPDEAIELILEIESLNDEAGFNAFLRSYEGRIRHLGSLAKVHLAQLKRATGRPTLS